MKKMLTLVLVLAVASLSSAAIMSPMSIADLGGGMFGIELTSGASKALDGQGGYWALIGANSTSGALAATIPSTFNLAAVAGDAGNTGLFGYGIGAWGEFTTTDTTAWTAGAGIYANSFTAIAPTLQLYRIDDGFTVATLVDTYTIPEPITMALLGVGGLFLRRKK